ncbi:hypothetical protein CK203_032491 [Vitis vinifera]|uniref:HAT C-terminal dimerisation domain-containing protein n=1 Tax=Vitis vinifera TaxID=29760 RepID=A0A438I6M0_VITVI|nr:hypothetical protein CK203_032491 [Vitis vinifera]
MNMGSEDVNEDLFGLEDEDFGEEINSRMNVTNISSGGSNRGGSGVTYPSFQPMIEAIANMVWEVVRIKVPAFVLDTMCCTLLDLMLEDIGKLPNIKRTLEKAISLNGSMGYIYEAMNRAKDTIVRSFNGNEEKYKEIFNIIDKRWEIQLHRPLHAAGYFLNLKFFYDKPEIEHDAEIMSDLYKCILRLTRDPVKQEKVMVNASGCERNWSIFENIHRRGEIDIDDGNEWLIGRMEDEDSHGGAQDDFVFDDDNLTWGDVARATGAEEARFDTRAKARARAS